MYSRMCDTRAIHTHTHVMKGELVFHLVMSISSHLCNQQDIRELKGMKEDLVSKCIFLYSKPNYCMWLMVQRAVQPTV